MKIPREQLLIIGGMRAARGGAAFAWAPLVVECQGQRYIVRHIPQAEPVEGEPMSDEEWRGVLLSGEALNLSKGQQAAPNAALWLLRRNFFFRDEAMDTLGRRGAVLYEELQEGTRLVLVDESVAGGLTDRWAERARKQAWHLIRAAWKSGSAERLSEVVEAAELAIDLAGDFLEDDMALVCLLYELQGDKDRAEAYLEMARNSRGHVFYERTCEKKERFARELAIESPPSPRRPRFGPKAYRRRDAALSESFDRICDKDAA
jgi:hypothetical protein